MNLPNKLTVLRVILIPFFVGFMLVGEPLYYAIALGIFCIASLTDLLDGKIARKYNLVTNFGKFMDPLADKLLVSAAMVCLVESGNLSSWMVIIIISREFIISGFRLIAADNGVVIAASYWGKFKTVFQMAMIIMIILTLAGIENTIFAYATTFVTWAALILTIVSLVDYLWKNKSVLSENNNK
jgi:CDP-diacylglycerol--glycerol-3-phosphate 3-phosphatidyltransferase